MCTTPGGTWRGCPYFGFRDILEDKSPNLDKQKLIEERINQTIDDFGYSGYRVEDVSFFIDPVQGEGQIHLTICHGSSRTTFDSRKQTTSQP